MINTETTKKENHISRPIAARSFVFVTCSQLSPTGVSFPPARFACFFSRVHSRTARGGRRSSSLSLCVERHPRLWMCASTSARIIIRRRRPGAGTRVDKGYIYRASSHFRRECPKSFFLLLLFMRRVALYSMSNRGSCRRFSFLCVVVSKALSKYFQKGHALGLGFKVTRGLARARRQRRAWTTTTPSYNTTMASSSSQSFVFRLLLRGRSKLSKPGRSIDR